ncbi:MAG: sigma-70 family RNA polymerase sigma factor [Luteolibacter sp.]|uniref:RNA polymerase sigma factor n=1 Tax=Luteolibacter sp. TaxID=1962973 RepID=UPI003267E281
MPEKPFKTRHSIFASTRWSIIGDAARGGDTRAPEALAAIFETYWPPLYRYVRRLGKQEQDAEDLVQGFFADLIETGGLRLADRDRGRFRAFLLASLKNHIASEWRRDHRQKRGGFVQHLSIDRQHGETGLCLELEDGRSPDKLFDREWALALLDKVLADLEVEANASEPGDSFARWMPFLSVSSATIPYADLAAESGMTEGAARVAVHRLRKRYRQRLRGEISRTLATDDLVDEEMNALFAALSE